MPPIRTSILSEPSCSIALVYRFVTCPCSVISLVRRYKVRLFRYRVTFHAVKTSAPAASRPAPSVSNWVRAASRAVWSSGPLGQPDIMLRDPVRRRPDERTIAAPSTTGCNPPTTSRMPHGQAAQRFSTRKTLGETSPCPLDHRQLSTDLLTGVNNR